MSRKNKSISPLVGKFFHSILADKETIRWQGRIQAEVSPGLYLVLTYEWIAGFPYEETLVPVSDMLYWKFYDYAEEMNSAYGDYCRRTKQREKQ